MGLQFERITYSSGSSLSLIMDDIMRQRADAAAQPASEMESWLNALQRQCAPLVASRSGRAQLEAWLDAVEQGAPL